MGRVAGTIALALILLSASGATAAEVAGKGSPSPSPSGKGTVPPAREKGVRTGGEHRLDEVKITGTPEAPDILFFLPRARFRLLPVRAEIEFRERFLALSPDLEKAPR